MWRTFSKWSSHNANEAFKTITHIDTILSQYITKSTLRVGRDNIVAGSRSTGMAVDKWWP